MNFWSFQRTKNTFCWFVNCYSMIVSLLKKIASSKIFEGVIIAAILTAGILIGVETYSGFANQYFNVLKPLDHLITGIFVLEILIKMGAEGRRPWRYFYDGWNIFDFVIVVMVLLPLGGSSIAILRLFRLLRVLKLLKALPQLQVLVIALLKSIPSMFYVSLLLLLLFYIYAVTGVFFFGDNDPVHFSDLQTSMLSLFRIVTLEDWTDIMYINMYGCENYGYADSMDKCVDSKAMPLFSALFFVSFVLIGTMIVLNLFIGIILSGMEQAQKELEHKKSAERGELSKKVTELKAKLDEIQSLLK